MKRTPPTKHARSMTFVLCMGMLAGVLIWAKLRLVTDIPRSAYADPAEVTADQIDDPASADTRSTQTLRDDSARAIDP